MLTSLNFSCPNNSSKLLSWPLVELGDKSEKPSWLSTSLLKTSTRFSCFSAVVEAFKVEVKTSLKLYGEQDPGVGEE